MIAAVVLAAGQSKRMRRTKQLLPLGGSTILGRVIETFRESKVDRIVLVVGSGSAAVKRSLDLAGVKTVTNRAFRGGMSGSLKAGLQEIQAEADAVIVALGDQPFVSPKTVDLLIQAYLREKPAVVLPLYRGRRGNPVLFDRSLFGELLGITGDVGAKSVVRRNESELLEVEVEDEGVVIDIDTPADYANGISREAPRGRRRSRARV